MNSSVYVSLRVYLTSSGLLLSSSTNAFFEDAMWLEELYLNATCLLRDGTRKLKITDSCVSCRSRSSLLVLMFTEDEI